MRQRGCFQESLNVLTRAGAATMTPSVVLQEAVMSGWIALVMSLPKAQRLPLFIAQYMVHLPLRRQALPQLLKHLQPLPRLLKHLQPLPRLFRHLQPLSRHLRRAAKPVLRVQAASPPPHC